MDDKTLLVGFYPEETDLIGETKELIKILLNLVQVESIIYGELGEDWTMFENYTKDNRQLLWTVDGLDDPESEEKYNSFLSKEEKETYYNLLRGEHYEKKDKEKRRIQIYLK